MYENISRIDGTAFGTVLGTSLARTIIGQLGVRIQFPDRTAELQELGVLTEALSGLEISEPELARVLHEEQASITTAAQETRLSEHDTMLAKGKILTVDPTDHEAESYVWQAVDPESRTVFSEILDEMRTAIHIKPLDEAAEVPAISDSTELEMASLLEAKVSAMLDDLKNNIPLPVKLSGVRKLGKLVAKVTGHAAGHPYYHEYIHPKRQEVINSSKDPARVSRKARELNKILGELTDNPHGLLVRLYIENQKSGIEQQAVDLLDKQIVGISRPYVAAKRVGRRVLRRQVPNVEPGTSSVPAQDVETHEDLELPLEVTKDPAEKLETLGTFELSMPWMPGGKTQAEVQRLTKDGNAVYITRGLPPKLATIAAKSRQKTPVTAEGRNQYDDMAIYEATVIASGHMPHHRQSPLRMIRKYTISVGYEGLTILYPPDPSHNAPRLYFAVKNIGTLIAPAVIAAQKLDPQSPCLIVLGETDKSNQTQVVSHFTGRTVRDLRRAGGTGSV